MWTTKVGVIEARVRTLIEIPLQPNGENVIMFQTPLFQIQGTVGLEIGLHAVPLRSKFPELLLYQCKKAVMRSEVETDLEAVLLLVA